MVGRTIKHYEIEAELGQGGMGVVYRAKDTVLGRTVALKFLPPMFAKDEDARKRFVHEAKAVSALDHPNVAVVHEIGTGDDGEMFLVMAFYEGQTLEDIIADGPVDLDDTVRYMLEAARGLSAAHGKGIIHRDIKPGNIMVTESGLLKILDFGLAKVSDVTMTMGAMSLGTLAYMSPEQAQGQPVDNRTDLWALGVVFYEMLAGKRPFDGPYDAAILYAAANEAHTTVQAWRSETPDHIAAVVDKLLQKKPELRYQSADDLISDLEQATAPTPSVIQPVQQAAPAAADSSMAPVPAPMDSSLGAPVGSQPSMMAPVPASGMTMQKALMIVIAAVVVIGTLVTIWVSMQGPTEPATTATSAAPKTAKEYVDEGVTYLNDGQVSLAQVSFERALEVDSTYAPAWTSIAGVFLQIGDPTSARSAARRAISLDGQSSGAWYNLGLAQADLGETESAINALTTAVQLNASFVLAYSAWADLLIEDGRPTEALGVLERGLSASSASNPYRFILYKNQGKAHLALDQPAEAINFLESSYRLKSDWAETVLLLGRAYDALGDGAQAQVYWEQLLELTTDPAMRAEARQRLGQ